MTEIVLQRYRGELVLLDKIESSPMENNQQELKKNTDTIEDFAGKEAALDDDIPF